MDFPSTMVAEIVIEYGQRFRYIILADPINDIESLIGMGMIEAKPVFAWRVLRCLPEWSGKQ